jgi:hypothetical protein
MLRLLVLVSCDTGTVIDGRVRARLQRGHRRRRPRHGRGRLMTTLLDPARYPADDRPCG